VIDQALSDLGPTLRRAREHAGLTLRDIADSTKLPPTVLKALEENRISHMPGGLFRRAIIRAYAGEVGLDGDSMVRAFVAQFPDEAPSPAVAIDPPSRVPRALHALLSIIGALIPLFAGVVYFTAGADGDARPRSPAAVASLQPASFAEPQRASLSDEHALAMMISVSSRTRVAVIADGREVVARELAAGEVVRASVSDEVVLLGDNAGAVHFSINGRPGRALGVDGAALSVRIRRAEYLSWLIQQ
jgi:transcriptional regulator with XRE-family HTH domain